MTKAIETLREAVCRANIMLGTSPLVMGTFGNVSGVDRDAGVFAIKPSGVAYAELTPDHMVLVSLATGEVVEGDLRPSSDTPTHHELYRAFPCGGIAHTHSPQATAFAHARTPIRCMGTTHADYFRGDIPVTRDMTPEEVEGDYERNTGLVIVEAFRGLAADEVAGVLVASHGPFTWGATPAEAIERSAVLEFLAGVEAMARGIAPRASPPARHLIDRHFLRKHGKDAYYGQP